jgi:hypothetical protein
VPELSVRVEGVEAPPFAAAPVLVFKLGLANRDPQERIRMVALRCQIQVETTRRRYSYAEQEKLSDLFGEPDRWGQTLRPLLWTHASVISSPFEGATALDLAVPCTFDFNVAATKYFAGLTEGEIPLEFLFSGTVFYESHIGSLQVAQIPWDREARYRLPIAIWRRMMDEHYPNTAWLSLRRDAFDRLYQYKVSRGIPTWEMAIESLIPETESRKTG